MRCTSALSLTLILGRVGRLGQIRFSRTPCKIVTLGTEIKNRPVDPFKVPFIKTEHAKKNFFGAHFPTEHNSVTEYNFSKISETNCFETKQYLLEV